MSTAKTSQDSGRTKALLAAGMVAGPLFIGVSLIQALTREGFDMRHHAFSLLTTGDLGWVQLINFVLAGILLLCGAAGMRRVLTSGKASKWGPRLISAFGVSAIAAGIFSADPALGFPPGTSTTAVSISWHGWIHFMVSSLGFISLIASCFVFARRFAGGWAVGSRILGVLLVVSLMGIASGSASANDFVTPAFIAAASLGYFWISAVAAKLKAGING